MRKLLYSEDSDARERGLQHCEVAGCNHGIVLNCLCRCGRIGAVFLLLLRLRHSSCVQRCGILLNEVSSYDPAVLTSPSASWRIGAVEALLLLLLCLMLPLPAVCYRICCLTCCYVCYCLLLLSAALNHMNQTRIETNVSCDELARCELCPRTQGPHCMWLCELCAHRVAAAAEDGVLDGHHTLCK